jgi:hypothetical protein
MHPVDGSQVSSVHGLLSLQATALPAQTPLVQTSLDVHELASSHVVPSGLLASAGQAPLDPVQVSAGSHGSTELRQVKLDDWKTSTQVLSVPVQ